MNTPKLLPLPEASNDNRKHGRAGFHASSGPAYTAEQMQAYALAAIEAQGVPDGWQLVPKKLTLEMLDAAAWGGIGYANLSGFRIAWDAALASAPPAPQSAPIDMVLHCPACGMQHIDAPETHEAFHGDSGPVEVATWTNPPHRSHLCLGCSHVWRPADVPTNGVAAVKTKGKEDSPLAAPQAGEGERHIATGEHLDWQVRVFHEEMDRLGVPRDDGEDFYSLWGRVGRLLDAERARAEQAAESQKPSAILHDDGYWMPTRTEAGWALNEQLSRAGTRVEVYTKPTQAAEPLTGGDERRHIICLCPDCVKPKPTTLETLHEFARRTASLLSEAQVELRCTAAGTLLIGVRYYEGSVRYGYQRGFTESQLSEPYSDTSWWGQLEEIAKQHKE